MEAERVISLVFERTQAGSPGRFSKQFLIERTSDILTDHLVLEHARKVSTLPSNYNGGYAQLVKGFEELFYLIGASLRPIDSEEPICLRAREGLLALRGLERVNSGSIRIAERDQRPLVRRIVLDVLAGHLADSGSAVVRLRNLAAWIVGCPHRQIFDAVFLICYLFGVLSGSGVNVPSVAT